MHGTTCTGTVIDGNEPRSQGVVPGVPTARISASGGEESKYHSARKNYTFSPAKTQDIVLEFKKVTFRKTTNYVM